MRTPHRGGRSAMELKMTPMIDVVFLLLVFFLWTSSFELPEFDLPSSLAEPPAGLSDTNSDQPPPEMLDELVITVDGSSEAPNIELNGVAIANLTDLAARLAEVVELGVQPPVIVDPEAPMTMGVVIDVYDTARAAGLDRVLFAADE